MRKKLLTLSCLFSFSIVSSVLTAHFLFIVPSFPLSPTLKNHMSSFTLYVCIPVLHKTQQKRIYRQRIARLNSPEASLR